MSIKTWIAITLVCALAALLVTLAVINTWLME